MPEAGGRGPLSVWCNLVARSHQIPDTGRCDLHHRQLVPLLLTLGLSSVAASQPAGTQRVGRSPGHTLPVVAEHRYTVTARIRPLLLFWISRDNVGEAVLRWRAGGQDHLGFELLIGSDPARTPRHVNQWGYIAEEVSPGSATLLGLMKDSDDKTLEEARKRVEGEGERRQFFYKAIRTEVAQNKGVTGTMRVTLPRDPTYRDVNWVLEQLPPSPHEPREYSLAPGIKPGYLPTLQGVVQESVSWHQAGEPAATSPVGRVVRYVFNGTMYDMVLRSSKRIAAARYRGRPSRISIHGEFVITNRKTGEKTQFAVQYPRAGALAGVPIHGVFRPRWWFEVEMTLDDPAGSPGER